MTLTFLISTLSALAHGDTKIYIETGMQYFQNQEYRKAIESFSKAIKEDPNAAEAFMMRGISRDLSGNCKSAVYDYTEVIRIKPGFAKAYYLRASCREDLNDIIGAIQDYRKALALDPSLASYYFENNNSTLHL